jgi:hypothetical protein
MQQKRVIISGRRPTSQEIPDLYGIPPRRVKQLVKLVDSLHRGTSKRASALRKRNTGAKVSKRAA